ncbi:MAG TPA: PaaI family thioesterase [Candidatus Acidoferrales bacterium]|nr:PaaI family thioesterase [Candidatus Acidoferrales bacterium]
MAEEIAARINALPSGWMKAMGLRVTRAGADEVACEWEVSEQHHQGYGIVHGGVFSGVIESLASIGAALVAMPRGQHVVGLENHTSFLRAVRGGRLRAVAVPITRGRRSQVWEGRVLDEQDRLVATGRVRLLCLEGDDELAGERIRGPLQPG